MRKRLLIYTDRQLVFVVAKQVKGKSSLIEYTHVEPLDSSGVGSVLERAKESIPAGYRGWMTLICADAILFTKHLTVPVVSPDKADAVLSSELSRRVPFSMDEVAWDVVELGSDGIERDVVLAAMPGDSLGDLCSGLEAIGFKVDRVSVCPSLAYRAYSENGANLNKTILVRIGVRGTEFLFCMDNGFHLRTLKVGAKEGLSAYEYGERLIPELQRSIASLQRQNEYYDPTTIVLWGWGYPEEETQDLGPVLEKGLGMAVRPWEVNAECGLKGLSDDLSWVYPLIQGALNWSDGDNLQFNLLPNGLKRKRMDVYESRCIAIGLSCWLMAGALLCGWGMRHYRSAMEVSLSLRNRLQEPLRIESRMNEIDQELKGIRSMGDALAQIEASRLVWVQFMQDLQWRLGRVEAVWMDRFKMDQEDGGLVVGERSGVRKDPYIYLGGCVLDWNHPLERVSPEMRLKVDDLIEQLRDSPYVEAVRNKKFDTSERGILRFECTLEMNKALGF